MPNKKELDIQIEEQKKAENKTEKQRENKFKNRLNETSLLPKSFVCQSGDWKWDWKCLLAALHTPHEAEADKYANIF